MLWSVSGILAELHGTLLLQVDVAAHAKRKTKTSETVCNFKTVATGIQIWRALTCYGEGVVKGADSSGNAEFPEVNGTQIKETLSEEGKGSEV